MIAVLLFFRIHSLHFTGKAPAILIADEYETDLSGFSPVNPAQKP